MDMDRIEWFKCCDGSEARNAHVANVNFFVTLAVRHGVMTRNWVKARQSENDFYVLVSGRLAMFSFSKDAKQAP
jgi:hypothetical protein